jgi:alkanesulfonate monooxygenase SsuD/methylene tetrahydromethanopterin reductase-like flavin-dependent oxidoreductase (luciferase family)
MVLSIARFNFVSPTLDRRTTGELYRAGVEMAAYADEAGFFGLSLEEHHGANDGWSPSPLINAGLMLGCTKQIRVTVSAVLVPLHDPLRLAEDIAVLDLASNGRITVIGGLGYRPEEYEAHGKDWSRRGALMDESIEAVLAAWSGEPFTYQGRNARVTPMPQSVPQPDLEALYQEECKANGTKGFVIMPPSSTTFTFVAEDPEEAWASLGEHFLHEAKQYAGWQTDAVHSAAYSPASTVEELRAEGKYRVLSPEECVAAAQEGAGVFVLHPLCGGLPPERGWDCLRLYVEQVLPALVG